MTEDNFHYELMEEAYDLAGRYLDEKIQGDGEEAVRFVRSFVELLSPTFLPETLEDPIKMALTTLVSIEVFKECFIMGYTHADKKVSAINALKNAFKEDE